jgi:haloalkane dehalogenase
MSNRKTLMIAAGAVLSGGLIAAAASKGAESRPDDPATDFFAHGFTRRDLATPAGQMAVYEAGEGDPVVFLHGIGGGASSWTWSFVAPSLADTHRVVIPDWVGWGASEHPRRFIRFDDYVTSLETLLEALDGPATVVAQSLACGFALALAERRPELFARLILHTPSGGKDFGEDAFGPVARTTITPFAANPATGFAFYRLLFHRRAFIGGWLKQEGFFDASAVTPQIIDAFLFNARRKDAAWSALPFANGSLRFDIAPLIQQTRVPARILWGAEETQVGLETGRRLAALRPDIPFDIIPQTKACPELERPDQILATIRQGLNG